MGTLYIVATPIGNLGDLSLRAVEILSRIEIIACEDTRRTGLLLKHIKSRHSEEPSRHPLSLRERARVRVDSGQVRMTDRPTLLSYYEQNEHKRIPQILNVLINGVDVALVSDAGTPTISDPGFKLVRECIAQGIKVESIPGPSSVISALVVSGLPIDKFLFIGYPPRKSGHRRKLFKNVLSSTKIIITTVILFESPHRLVETLEELKNVFGGIDIVIARELTKLHEEVRREKISESIEYFTEVQPRGEFVILFHI